MSNPLDIIADEIANAITGQTPVKEEPEILSPLVFTPETMDPTVEGRDIDALHRYVLPTFPSIFNALPTEGASNRTLHNLPRDTARSLTVIFPEPIWSIWLDPRWSTPGAMIGVASQGSNRGDFVVLTPGDGIRFGRPIRKVKIFNADGLEQVCAYPPNVATNASCFPFGYASFLIGLTENASYSSADNDAVLNVSPLVHFNTYNFLPGAITDPPVDGLANSDKHVIAVGKTKAIRIQAGAITAINTRAIGGFSLTLTPWYISAVDFTPGGSPPIVLDSLLLSNTGTGNGPYVGQWIKDAPISLSCVGKGGGLATVNAGASKIWKVPPSAMAVTFSITGVPSTAGNVNNVQLEYYAQ
jgi:hypothetical protein